MQGFYFLKSSVEKAEVRVSGIDFRLCSTPALKKKSPLSLVQQLCVLVGNVTKSSEYLAYGIDPSMNTK